MNFLPSFGADASPAPTVLEIPPRTVRGISLAHMLTGKSPIAHAFIAGDLHRGASVLTCATLRQSALLTGASVGYVFAASKLSAPDRRRVLAGLDSLIARKPRAPETTKGDAEVIADIVDRVGVDRALEMIIETSVSATAA
jgi:hypothetical protein